MRFAHIFLICYAFAKLLMQSIESNVRASKASSNRNLLHVVLF